MNSERSTRKPSRDHDADDSSLPTRQDAASADGTDSGEFRVDDRRHWTKPTEDDDAAGERAPKTEPSVVGEFRRRAEEAEQKLQEYIEAFKRHKEEHESFRARLARDVDRRVDLQFGELVRELLETMDNLDLALTHVEGVSEAEPLAQGVAMARDHFVATLEAHGVESIEPTGTPFDPNEAEAMRLDPVDSPDGDGVVTETLQTGYRLGERVIRPARVAVGRLLKNS